MRNYMPKCSDDYHDNTRRAEKHYCFSVFINKDRECTYVMRLHTMPPEHIESDSIGTSVRVHTFDAGSAIRIAFERTAT